MPIFSELTLKSVLLVHPSAMHKRNERLHSENLSAQLLCMKLWIPLYNTMFRSFQFCKRHTPLVVVVRSSCFDSILMGFLTVICTLFIYILDLYGKTMQSEFYHKS